MTRWLAVLIVALLFGCASAEVEHIVVVGDTLSQLATTYGSSVVAIRSRNGLAGSEIRVGQVLVIPVEPEVVAYRLHLAASTESLVTLAVRFALPLASLRSANPNYGADSDLAGQLVVVPPGPGITVWVAEGETLLDLSIRYGVAPSVIAGVNGLDSATPLAADQPVLIPDGTEDPQEDRTASGAPLVARSTVQTPALGGADGRERHRQLQLGLLARAADYADAIDRPSEEFLLPLAGRLSSAFGWRNISVGGNRFHGGIDLAAATGTPITAARDGVVTKSGWGGAYGYVVFLDHGDNSQTRYAHLSRIDVAEGVAVRQGDVLGLVGSTGASTGPHLHFELRFSGRAVDPLLYLEPALP